jgi:hypothetical protein
MDAYYFKGKKTLVDKYADIPKIQSDVAEVILWG